MSWVVDLSYHCKVVSTNCGVFIGRSGINLVIEVTTAREIAYKSMRNLWIVFQYIQIRLKKTVITKVTRASSEICPIAMHRLVL